MCSHDSVHQACNEFRIVCTLYVRANIISSLPSSFSPSPSPSLPYDHRVMYVSRISVDSARNRLLEIYRPVYMYPQCGGVD